MQDVASGACPVVSATGPGAGDVPHGWRPPTDVLAGFVRPALAAAAAPALAAAAAAAAAAAGGDEAAGNAATEASAELAAAEAAAEAAWATAGALDAAPAGQKKALAAARAAEGRALAVRCAFSLIRGFYEVALVAVSRTTVYYSHRGIRRDLLK